MPHWFVLSSVNKHPDNQACCEGPLWGSVGRGGSGFWLQSGPLIGLSVWVWGQNSTNCPSSWKELGLSQATQELEIEITPDDRQSSIQKDTAPRPGRGSGKLRRCLFGRAPPSSLGSTWWNCSTDLPLSRLQWHGGWESMIRTPRRGQGHLFVLVGKAEGTNDLLHR